MDKTPEKRTDGDPSLSIQGLKGLYSRPKLLRFGTLLSVTGSNMAGSFTEADLTMGMVPMGDMPDMP